MAKVQKTIYISEDDIILSRNLQEKYGLSSDGQVFSYLLRKQEEEKEKWAVAIREELEKNYLDRDRTKWGIRTAEQNSIMLMDAMNTLLHVMQIETCIPLDVAPSPVMDVSKKRMKEKIAYFKQKSDERKSKGKT